MKVATLIGFGANDVTVPCMLFESMEEGRKYVTEALKQEPIVAKDGSLYWDVDERLDDPIDEEPPVDTARDAYRCASNRVKNKPRLAEKFFTGYYSGCGGCYSFGLKEVETGKPFVRFDLD